MLNRLIYKSVSYIHSLMESWPGLQRRRIVLYFFYQKMALVIKTKCEISLIIAGIKNILLLFLLWKNIFLYNANLAIWKEFQLLLKLRSFLSMSKCRAKKVARTIARICNRSLDFCTDIDLYRTKCLEKLEDVLTFYKCILACIYLIKSHKTFYLWFLFVLNRSFS